MFMMKIITFTKMKCNKESLLRLLINTDIIHIQKLWEFRCVLGIAGGMDRAIDMIRFPANKFHDVNFAGCGRWNGR